jgi:predicted patatin/cPLA2 family phospholipase
MKRSLILAGGGLKVAFQAGVLQVWLDEANLRFDHVDAASGGVFNLAMMAQGMTGRQIADNWRNLNPRAGISFDVSEIVKLGYAESLFTLDNYRKHVFPAWGLNWDRIRASTLEATFNVFNFSTKRLEVLEPAQMNEELFVACVSLPMWFPPVRYNGHTYIDSVFITDANIEEAIRRGADELWVIWTVSDKDEWNPGFVANYFQIIETSAVGHYRAILDRIDANNHAIARGEVGEFGRLITVRELKADVALHYLINFSQDRLAEAVNLGVQRARQWCAEQGIALHQPAPSTPPVRASVEFTEEMKGFVTFGETDFQRGHQQGERDGSSFMFRLTISTGDIDHFVTDPAHATNRVRGWVRCDALGGQFPVEQGRFNLFVDQQDPAAKRMFYRLFFRDSVGNPVTLTGFKRIEDNPGRDLWSDTTTLFVRLLKGHVEEDADAHAPVLGAGILIIQPFDFLRQLTTFRAEAPGGTVGDRISALSRFGRLFFGKLWDAYARRALTSGPF